MTLDAYHVAPDGDDTTGTGSYAAPFATVTRAALAAASVPVDAIEIASGTVVETAALPSPTGFRVIRGRGADKTTVALDLTDWLSFDSADAPRLLLLDLSLRTLQDDATILAVSADDEVTGNVTFVRCRILLGDGSVAIGYEGPDPQSFVPKLTADLIHCVVEGPATGDRAGYVTRGIGSPSNAVAARNCIFRRLASVNVIDTQPFDSDANCYHDNDRDLTLGAYGPHDLRGIDPLLVAGTFQPQQGSPLIGAGVDLRLGYGRPPRILPEDVNVEFPGAFPTIGIVEPIRSGARTSVVATNMHAILRALAQEVEIWRLDRARIERDRTLRTASGLELGRRFGLLTGIRFVEGDVERYRDDLRRLLQSALEHAPTWHAVRRTVEVLFGHSAKFLRKDYSRRYHFQVGRSLKLWADTSGGLPTYDFYLTSGELRLEDRWIRVRQADFSVAAATATHTVYVDGSDALDSDDEALVKISTDEIQDESAIAISGTLTFRHGETRVEASADLPAYVQRYRRLMTGFGPEEFVIESVDGARTLTLRYPFPEEDHVGLAWAIVPNIVFGRVIVDEDAGIVAIESPGRVGHTTRPVTRDTRAHAYELILDADGTAFASASVLVRLLFDVLGHVHPVHKLAYFRLRSDTRSLIVGQPWPYAAQSNANYAEIFDDPAWFYV